MKKLFKSLICMLLVCAVTVIMVGCGNNLNFKEDSIIYIHYHKTNSKSKNNQGYIYPEDSEANATTISQCYNILKDEVKFNSSMPKKDFWTRKEIEYKEPADGIVVTFYYGEGSYIIKIYSGRVYKYGDWINYSTKGSHIEGLLQNTTLIILENAKV